MDNAVHCVLKLRFILVAPFSCNKSQLVKAISSHYTSITLCKKLDLYYGSVPRKS